jgi:glyoxylase-like metal-dependent hydrolase (beta-lactamase superfamily II)
LSTTVRCTASLVAVIAALTASAAPSSAQAPPAKAQAPGFYRMMLGDVEVVALNDGVIAYPSKLVLPTASPELIASSLHAAGLTDPVGMSYNAFLLNTGGKVILIDTGTGGKLADNPGFRGAGRVLANLRAAGYEPAQVDEVYITHVGPDHIGGLTTGEERTYPNAVVRMARAESTAYLDVSKATAADSVWYRFRASLFEPYARAGRFETFEGDTTFPSGIRALATRGHTPGHTSYVIESRGEKLIILGDVVHLGAVQFAEPSLPTNFDADRAGGGAQRRRMFELAARDDYWIAAAHLSFPGIGHVRGEAGRYRWAPANYAIP